ncbi:hypothetical protein JW921_09690 [Candidatus Fermentibacterales bacterium]|nr:hypothetical protein [Candidatus Fermentibacterales bacterium]
MTPQHEEVKETMARETVRTPENQAALVEHLGRGCGYRIAARIVGIGESTFRLWRAEDSDFAAMCSQAIADVEEEIESDAVWCIRQRIEYGDWRTAAWWLAHRCPEKYSERRIATPRAPTDARPDPERSGSPSGA